MALSAAATRVLSNGRHIPVVGFGVYELPDSLTTTNLVKSALQAGYRHIDTAADYGNELETGRGIRESGIPREEIFVTTKLNDPDHGYDKTIKAFHDSLGKLGLGYIDLYLVHSPNGGAKLRQESWQAMEKLYHDGLIKSLGVSNYGIHHLRELMTYAQVLPTVNQIELHPWQTQPQIAPYCQRHGIQVEAYSSLARGEKATDPILQTLATKYNRAWFQILIRWSLQHGYIPLTKTATDSRIPLNLEVFNFTIVEEDMKALDDLNEDLHLEWDPTVVA
ncbi:hypothetical protein H4R33_006553 [Dimargaris cristalligena]|uniref:Putative aldo/keto reductase n=1 Tax=Dimargaris cristalligena TaxID=215637 RepID=A0A4P9ZPI0_9FUNG|nr:hypothetical protein H4R33_006553 [Dimargaris cristalligena]RKP34492.1 putative aldo/keto reductase [Dimargaris cristalligena]|eukprot:RKP34492.1 putative aldo/keto reductase [Dimargaris cristalligena]